MFLITQNGGMLKLLQIVQKGFLKIAGELNKNVHVLHISTKDEIELLKSHKTFATCEATPQHLFFKSPDCYERLGTFAQMNPLDPR